jgi:hypothetical protein
MTNNLPKSAAQITYEADKASAEAFQKQYGLPIEAVPVIKDPTPKSTHFIDVPTIPAPKSEAQFMHEFFAETGYHDQEQTEVGKVATDNVVHVDFAQTPEDHDGVA